MSFTTALPEIPALLTTLFENSPYALVIVAPDYKIVAINRLASQQISRALNQPVNIGDSARTLAIKLNLPDFEDLFRKALTGRVIKSKPFYSQVAGQDRWVELQYLPVVDNAGKVYAICLQVSDVTGQWHAEKAKERYRLLSENTLDIILFIRHDGTILEATQAAALAYGYSLEELLSLNIRDLRAPLTKPAIKEQLRRGGTTGMLMETYHIRKDGTTFPVEVSSHVIKLDNERVLLSVVRDITKRKQAEEALKNSEELYRTLVNNMPGSAVCFFGHDLRHLVVKGASLPGLNFSGEDLVGKTLDEVASPGVSAQLTPYYHAALEGKETSAEISYQDRVYIARSASVRNDNDVIVAGMLLITDITDVKNTEKALQYRLEFEQQIAAISTNFINLNADEIDEEINRALASIGHFTGSDRCYIVLFSDDDTLMSNTHEWCTEGVEPQIHLLQNIPMAELPWSMGVIRQLENLHLPSLELLPEEARLERESLRNRGIKSVLLVPLVYKKKAVGYLGFSSIRNNRTWSSDDISLLRITGETLISAIKRKITEQELVAEQNFAQVVLDTMGQGLTISDTESRFVFVNPALANLLGYAPEELLGLRPIDLAHPEDKPIVADTRRRRVKGETTTYEVRLVHRDGSTRYVIITGAPLLQGSNSNLRNVVAVITDLTERKRAEELLEESEHRLRTVISNVPLMFFVLDNKGSVIFAEGQGFNKIGADPEQFVEQYILDKDTLLGKDTRQALAGNTIHSIREAAGRHFEIWYSPLKDNEGRPAGTIGVALEITERVRAEEEMRLSLEKEQELSSLKSRFISIASHEFRTPLTTILSSTELLQNYGHKWTPDRTLELYKRIKVSVKNMTGLLDEVLLINKAAAGKLEFRPVNLDLPDFCNQLIEEIRLGSGVNHKFDLDVRTTTYQVRADEKLMRQLLSNLLTNAIKYSPDGSTVSFSLTYQKEKAIFVVKDQGIGIPEEGLKHLFEIFYRAENVGNIKGTGLGLSIVKECVEAHQGTINVTSEEGHGTTFTVSLPILY